MLNNQEVNKCHLRIFFLSINDKLRWLIVCVYVFVDPRNLEVIFKPLNYQVKKNNFWFEVKFKCK